MIVSDIASDPLWARFRDLASERGLRACYSTPIWAAGGEVLGTFAIYDRRARRPLPEDRRIAGLLAQTAAVAIQRDRSARERVCFHPRRVASR